MSTPSKRKMDKLSLPEDKVAEIINAKELMPRVSASSLAKVLKIDDKRKVAKVLSEHKNSPNKIKTPTDKSAFDFEIDNDSASSSGRSFDTLQDAMQHKTIVHSQKKLNFSSKDDIDDMDVRSPKRKLLDAADGLIQWAEAEIDSANALKEMNQGKIGDLETKIAQLTKENDDLRAEKTKNSKPVNYKDFCIVCGKPWALTIQELSFCSTNCAAEAAKRMKRATGAKQ